MWWETLFLNRVGVSCNSVNYFRCFPKLYSLMIKNLARDLQWMKCVVFYWCLHTPTHATFIILNEVHSSSGSSSPVVRSAWYRHLTVIASRFRVWNPARANHFLPTHTWPQQKKQLLHINDHIHNLLLFLSKLVHLPETEEKKTTNKTLVCSAWAVSDRLDFSLHNCHHLFQAHKLLVNCELTFQPQSDLQYLFSPNTKQTTHYERIKQIQFVTQMWNHKPAIIVKLSLVLYITQYSLLCERDITVTFQIQSWLNPFIRSVWQL